MSVTINKVILIWEDFTGLKTNLSVLEDGQFDGWLNMCDIKSTPKILSGFHVEDLYQITNKHVEGDVLTLETKYHSSYMDDFKGRNGEEHDQALSNAKIFSPEYNKRRISHEEKRENKGMVEDGM